MTDELTRFLGSSFPRQIKKLAMIPAITLAAAAISKSSSVILVLWLLLTKRQRKPHRVQEYLHQQSHGMQKAIDAHALAGDEDVQQSKPKWITGGGAVIRQRAAVVAVMPLVPARLSAEPQLSPFLTGGRSR